MDNEQRIAGQMQRGMTRQQACMTLGIPYTAPEHTRPSFTMEALKDVCNENLYRLACDALENPSAYKPSEHLAISNAGLDRAVGKAAQSITVDTKATVTHEHVMKLPAAEAYRLLIEGDKALTGLPVLEVEPVRGGGDTAQLAAGEDGCEAPPQNTPYLGGSDIWK